MAETATTDAAQTTAPPPPNDEPKKFAGRYDTAEAFETGFKELHKSVTGEEMKEPVWGKDGRFTDVLKAEQQYKDLQRVQGRIAAPKKTDEPAKPAESLAVKPAETPALVPANTDAILKAVGIENSAIIETWTKDQKLTDEMYTKFEAKGYSREVVNTYIAGQKAIADVRVVAENNAKAEAVKLAGGEQQHETLRRHASMMGEKFLGEWADKIQKDPANYPKFIEAVNADYAAKNGTSGSRSTVNGGSPTAGPVVAKQGEWTALMKRASNGDESAKQIILNTPQSVVDSWRSL